MEGRGLEERRGMGDSPTVISRVGAHEKSYFILMFLLFSVGKQNFIKHARVVYTNLRNNRRKLS